MATFTDDPSYLGTVEASNVNFKYYVNLVKRNEIPWEAFVNLLDDLTPSYVKSKQLISVLLEEFKKSLKVDNIRRNVKIERNDLENDQVATKLQTKSQKIGRFEQIPVVENPNDPNDHLNILNITEQESSMNEISLTSQNAEEENGDDDFTKNSQQNSQKRKRGRPKKQSLENGVVTFKCNICERSFQTKTSMDYHVQAHMDLMETNDESTIEVINDENETDTSKENIDVNPTFKTEKVEGFDEKDEDEEPTSKKPKLQDSKISGEKKAKCELCEDSREYAGKFSLKQHYISLHKLSVEEAREKVKGLKSEINIAKAKKKRLDKSFTDGDDESTENVDENGQKEGKNDNLKMKCDICLSGKEYTGKLTLTNHYKIFHQMGKLEIQEKTKDLKDLRFKCEHCDKICVSKIDLKGHTSTHTGEKPFSCVRFVIRNMDLTSQCMFTRKSTILPNKQRIIFHQKTS